MYTCIRIYMDTRFALFHCKIGELRVKIGGTKKKTTKRKNQKKTTTEVERGPIQSEGGAMYIWCYYSGRMNGCKEDKNKITKVK